jgi:hypothetical protein
MAKPTQRAGQYGIETIKLAFGTAFATLMQLIQADTNKETLPYRTYHGRDGSG